MQQYFFKLSTVKFADLDSQTAVTLSQSAGRILIVKYWIFLQHETAD